MRMKFEKIEITQYWNSNGLKIVLREKVLKTGGLDLLEKVLGQ